MKPPDRVEQIAALPLWAPPLLRACGIHGVDELGAHTPETLAALLRERILLELTPARIEAEDWIGQARLLSAADPDQGSDDEAADAGGEPADSHDDPAVPAVPPVPSSEAGPEVEVTSPGNPRQLGGFTVFVDAVNGHPDSGEWRVRVYHDESGEEVLLPTIEPGPWAAWILSKALEEREPSLYHLVVTIEESTVTTADASDSSVGVTLRVDGLDRLERALAGATVGAVLGGSR